MRPIIAFAILWLGLSSAAPEPEYASLMDGSVQTANGDGEAASALIEIESSIGRGDRLAVAGAQDSALRDGTLEDGTLRLGTRQDDNLQTGSIRDSSSRDGTQDSIQVATEIFRPNHAARPVTLASATADLTPAEAASVTAADDNPGNTDNPGTPEVSLDDLCHALYTSAQNNDLPVPFFANLIWQESRLRDDAVSRKGALGIAQFMPKVATENGLDNPFDPLQAIPASARLLRTLRLQFGNLGFVAAAYNAGAHRVAEWLEHRGSLPQETRTYVVRVTGLSVDAWRSMPVTNDALTFVRHLPCRSMPSFASVEQTQQQQAELDEAKFSQEETGAPAPSDPAPAGNKAKPQAAASKPEHDGRNAHREAHQDKRERHEAHNAGPEHSAAKRVAEHTAHGRSKHRSA